MMPNWRYYLRLKHSKEEKRFGRYSDCYWKPNRRRLFILNGYKNNIMWGIYT